MVAPLPSRSTRGRREPEFAAPFHDRMLLGSLACLLVLAPHLALAETGSVDERSVRARRLFEEGVGLMRESRWAAAEERFRRSVDLYPTQAGLFNLGSAVIAQDRPHEALAVFDEYLERYGQTASESELAEVGRMRDRALSLLCSVSLDVSPAGAEVLVDGRSLGRAPLEAPLLLRGGEHTFEASLEGYERRELRRELLAGCGREAIAISLRPADASDGEGGTPIGAPLPSAVVSRPLPATAVAGWILLAIGGSAGVAASVTGGFALSLRSEFSQMSMTEDWEPVQRQGRTLALVTDILIGLAAAAAATSIPLLVYGYRQHEGAR